MNAFVGVTYLAILFGLILGWIMNLVSFFSMSWDVVTGEFIVRLIGVIFVPLGGIVGWF